MQPTLTVRLGFASTLVVACLFACGGPTAGEVSERSSKPICEKVKECAGDESFMQAYPGGVEECVVTTTAKVKEGLEDVDSQSVCTDAEVDKCLADLKAMTCPDDIAKLKPPCEC